MTTGGLLLLLIIIIIITLIVIILMTILLLLLLLIIIIIIIIMVIKLAITINGRRGTCDAAGRPGAARARGRAETVRFPSLSHKLPGPGPKRCSVVSVCMFCWLVCFVYLFVVFLVY